MLCERCGKHEASFHYHESVNGAVKDIHLCADCAAEAGYGNLFHTYNPFSGFNVNDFLGSIFSQNIPPKVLPSGKTCSFCGTSFEDLVQSAMAGCANCYTEFYNELLPSIQRIHGKTRHVGKIPGTAGKEIRLKNEISTLKKQLDEVVAAQEYEKAAEIRDKIKEMEKKVQGE